MLPGPWAATTGARTTTMAPVGPETWTLDPPMTAAHQAGYHSGDRARPPRRRPELTPKASASGSATMPTVMPAKRSVFQREPQSVVVAAGRLGETSGNVLGCPGRA